MLFISFLSEKFTFQLESLRFISELLSYAKKLQQIVIPSGSKLKISCEEEFARVGIKSIHKIGENAFYECYKHQIIEIDENSSITREALNDIYCPTSMIPKRLEKDTFLIHLNIKINFLNCLQTIYSSQNLHIINKYKNNKLKKLSFYSKTVKLLKMHHHLIAGCLDQKSLHIYSFFSQQRQPRQ